MVKWPPLATAVGQAGKGRMAATAKANVASESGETREEGSDGPLMDITDGVVDFGQFGTVGSESPIITGPIPTLSEWAMIVFAAVLLAAGVFLILGRLS